MAARTLSGGNQQKVVVARESSRASRLIVADQPTRGVDIGASYGSYIYAVKSGTVVGSKYSWGGYGNYVEIDHGNGNFTLYAHMSERLVEVGEYVEQGEVIGLCGSTGISTGPHVHYEIWENYSRINPLNRLPGYIPYWW